MTATFRQVNSRRSQHAFQTTLHIKHDVCQPKSLSPRSTLHALGIPSAMPATLNRLYKRLHGEKSLDNGTTRGRRLRPSPASQTPTPQQRLPVASQIESAFVCKLPPEIRQLVYREIMRGDSGVVHVVKKPRKPLELLTCRKRCLMDVNFRCIAGEKSGGSVAEGGGLLSLLLTCQRL